MDIKSRVKDLTLKLVAIPSISETDGENECARFIHGQMARWPYFMEHPQLNQLIPIPHDPLGRFNVVSIVKGGIPSKDTVVLLGHIDTVATDDYGDLKSLATNPVALIAALKTRDLDQESKRDLDSGEWMFGRGAFDMKSGLAAQMILMEDICQRLDTLKGNIVFLAVPDEENNSAGMLAAVDTLLELTEAHDFRYLAAVDSDYTSPRFPGDTNHYVYVGTVGKLLPSFFVVGKETHVGQSFEGFDPNQLAAELTRDINLSMDLCDGAEGEYPSPPISLRMKDTKNQYSVQTAGGTHLFFNYPTHQSTPDLVLEKLVQKAKASFNTVIERLNAEYKGFCEANKIPFQPLPWKPIVMTMSELLADLSEKLGPGFTTHMKQFQTELLQDGSLDGRDYGLKVVDELVRYRTSKEPMVVVFFLPPYYPHIYVKGEIETEKRLLAALNTAILEAETETNTHIIAKKFYPYISDLSYFSTGCDMDTLRTLTDNMPGWGNKYSLPLDSIARLNLPVVNIGPTGKDAHKYTERLHEDYSFQIVPMLLEKLVKKLLTFEGKGV